MDVGDIGAVQPWLFMYDVSCLRISQQRPSNSIYDLSKTLSELQNLRRGNDFKWHMSNAETWVSSALTNENTCLEGFTEIDGKVRSDVKRAITNVAKVTSNALYLITSLDVSRG